jgi:hypothetical protein
MVMVADFGAAGAAEKFLRPIRASAVISVGFLVIDPAHFEQAREGNDVDAFFLASLAAIAPEGLRLGDI